SRTGSSRLSSESQPSPWTGSIRVRTSFTARSASVTGPAPSFCSTRMTSRRMSLRTSIAARSPASIPGRASTAILGLDDVEQGADLEQALLGQPAVPPQPLQEERHVVGLGRRDALRHGPLLEPLLRGAQQVLADVEAARLRRGLGATQELQDARPG